MKFLNKNHMKVLTKIFLFPINIEMTKSFLQIVFRDKFRIPIEVTKVIEEFCRELCEAEACCKAKHKQLSRDLFVSIITCEDFLTGMPGTNLKQALTYTKEWLRIMYCLSKNDRDEEFDWVHRKRKYYEDRNDLESGVRTATSSEAEDYDSESESSCDNS